MGQVDLVHVEWENLSGKKVQGHFIKHSRGYIPININSGGFIEEFPEGARIRDAEVTMQGRLD